MDRLLKSNSNIILVGFMGTGKTSIGKRLSSHLRMRYIDTDNVIERDSRRWISDIFAEDGEQVFRDLETEAVIKVSKLRNHVISTGGGVVLREENMRILMEYGLIFCLTATPEEIFRRIGHQTHRPLLRTPNPMETIRNMLDDRSPFYSKADFMVDTTEKSFSDVISHIKGIYNNTISS